MPSDKETPANDIQNKDAFEQVVEKLKSSNNILVTISTDPTVDQFAACIGLTLILNKVNKHANAVFSGKVPSTIDFLKPEKTLEKNTDSLRDFIIALDKSKADKLRYKVEENVVKIFITPYRTSISEKDLSFSQGDFNIDAIIALGIKDKHHLDQAILAHGRILHDASVISINTSNNSKLGSINWSDERASSLCEMVADVALEIDNEVFDKQNATALLTGIVAETDRYSNEKAAPHTMSVAGLLMSAGASTQLVSSELDSELKVQEPAGEAAEAPTDDGNGLLEIDHIPDEGSGQDQEPDNKGDDGNDDNEGQAPKLDDIPPPPIAPSSFDTSPAGESEIPPEEPQQEDESSGGRRPPRVMREPPQFGGQLTASSQREEDSYTGSTDPLSNLPDRPILSRPEDNVKRDDSLFPEADESGLAKGRDIPAVRDDQTLSDIEKTVKSPHAGADDPVGDASLDEVRDAVLRAEGNAEAEIENVRPQPREDLGTSELGPDLHEEDRITPETATLDPKNTANSSASPPPPVPPPPLPPEA
ncbi:MAG TPA: hypothetical protein VFK11_01510 [Candidatus Saccharimonadales bacterium]|nr:hypothetical protein [Candidatus Saccharimonadales bacterium]